ncbi:MATE family efflux transporter [Robinsoniella peoriensis]|uniref:MATE family efflux transporter n=1 Tax=Robinsoniella peoriensis TaxID=180332 RepID=UPI000694DD8F|nr:MATE family efflux transporter [Robinsoniella peoriensis]
MFSNQDLRKLIFPLVIEQALVMMVGIVDTVMVSYVGEAAISGVALVDMINYLIIVVLSAIDTGGAVIVSQYLGRKDKKNAGRCASQLLLVTVLLSIAIMGICLVFHTMILELLFGAIDADVKKAAVTYFLITALSFPFLGIYNSSAAIFRSMQKTKITMYVSVLINVINIAGDAIGIFVLHAGVAGVAVPTLVSRMAGAVIMLAMSFNEKNQVSVKMREIFDWNKETVKKILRIAVPNGIENGLFALGKVLVTSIVALFGTYQIAANGVANGIDQIAILVVNAINLAVVTVVGQCSGAGEYELYPLSRTF